MTHALHFKSSLNLEPHKSHSWMNHSDWINRTEKVWINWIETVQLKRMIHSQLDITRALMNFYDGNDRGGNLTIAK